MLTIVRIMLGAAFSLAGIIGALWFLITLHPGLAFVCFVGSQTLAALFLPDDLAESAP